MGFLVIGGFGRVYLRELLPQDAPALAAGADDPELARLVSPEGDFPSPYTLENAQRFIAFAQAKLRAREEFHLGMFTLEDNVFVGCVGLMEIDREGKDCELGYWVGRRYRRMGYAVAGVRAALSFAFGELALERVWADSVMDNESSLGLLKKLGFLLIDEKEGHFCLRRRSFVPVEIVTSWGSGGAGR